MFVIYGASLVLWMLLMDVGAEKSWSSFNTAAQSMPLCSLGVSDHRVKERDNQ